MSKKDDDLLEEIRTRYRYASGEWKEIREAGDRDIQCISGDIWAAMDPQGLAQRKEAVRPYVFIDELGQYVNQVINDLRQNKRGIKVSPVGFGANDQTATFRQGRIRDIEYRSNAQQAYTVMAANAIQRGYGFLRVRAKYVRDDAGFEQEPVIEPILNPNQVTPDPDDIRTDGSGWKYLFNEESRTEAEFKKEFPKAEKKSFSLTDTEGGWYTGTKIRLAEYWTKEPDKTRTLYRLKVPPSAESPDGFLEVYADQLNGKQPSSDVIDAKRQVQSFKVLQYLTNGFEILDKKVWPGKSIPFVACYGKILYVTTGGMTKKKMLSMVRLALDSAMKLCAIDSAEMELIGMTPKFPYFVYSGQLTQDSANSLAKSLHEPVAYIEVSPTAPATGTQLLPHPQRQPYDPAIQALEIAKESARRNIQASIGVAFLPTQAQRQNEKSGKALDKINDSAQKGSFHFVDVYDEAITRTGAILDELIPVYDDTAKEVSVRNPDDSPEMVRINDPLAVDAKGKPRHIQVSADHRHDVTISVGPQADSERDQASDFADTLVQNIELIAKVSGPHVAAEVLSQSIKLKNVGPIGDALADIISPKEQNDPRAIMQQAAGLKHENDQLKQVAQKMSEDLKTDKVKIDGQIQMKGMDLAFEKWKAILDARTKIAVAGIQAKTAHEQLLTEDYQHIEELVDAEHDRAHEVGMAALAHGQAVEQSRRAAQQQAILADQGQQHAIEQGAQSHAQALAQGDQANAAAQEQAQQAADLAPKPEAGA